MEEKKVKPINKKQLKLEFSKNNRKYSPEVDMGRVLLQS